jgi:hypothetical protein
MAHYGLQVLDVSHIRTRTLQIRPVNKLWKSNINVRVTRINGLANAAQVTCET